MPNNIIPSDPGRVGLEVVDSDHEWLIVKAEKFANFGPDRRVIARCDNRQDAEAIVHWVREGLAKNQES